MWAPDRRAALWHRKQNIQQDSEGLNATQSAAQWLCQSAPLCMYGAGSK